MTTACRCAYSTFLVCFFPRVATQQASPPAGPLRQPVPTCLSACRGLLQVNSAGIHRPASTVPAQLRDHLFLIHPAPTSILDTRSGIYLPRRTTGLLYILTNAAHPNPARDTHASRAVKHLRLIRDTIKTRTIIHHDTPSQSRHAP